MSVDDRFMAAIRAKLLLYTASITWATMCALFSTAAAVQLLLKYKFCSESFLKMWEHKMREKQGYWLITAVSCNDLLCEKVVKYVLLGFMESWVIHNLKPSNKVKETVKHLQRKCSYSCLMLFSKQCSQTVAVKKLLCSQMSTLVTASHFFLRLRFLSGHGGRLMSATSLAWTPGVEVGGLWFTARAVCAAFTRAPPWKLSPSRGARETAHQTLAGLCSARSLLRGSVPAAPSPEPRAPKEENVLLFLLQTVDKACADFMCENSLLK